MDFRVIQTDENKPRNILEEIVWYAADDSQFACLSARRSLLIDNSLCVQA